MLQFRKRYIMLFRNADSNRSAARTGFAMLILNNKTLLFSATKNKIIRSITVNEDGSWSMEVFLLAGGPS